MKNDAIFSHSNSIWNEHRVLRLVRRSMKNFTFAFDPEEMLQFVLVQHGFLAHDPRKNHPFFLQFRFQMKNEGYRTRIVSMCCVRWWWLRMWLWQNEQIQWRTNNQHCSSLVEKSFEHVGHCTEFSFHSNDRMHRLHRKFSSKNFFHRRWQHHRWFLTLIVAPEKRLLTRWTDPWLTNKRKIEVLVLELEKIPIPISFSSSSSLCPDLVNR